MRVEIYFLDGGWKKYFFSSLEELKEIKEKIENQLFLIDGTILDFEAKSSTNFGASKIYIYIKKENIKFVEFHEAQEGSE